MKHLIFLISVFFTLLPVYSQINVSGKITDQKSGKAIPYVVISDNCGKVLTQTDDTGYYSVELSAPDNLHFIHLAYDPATIRIDSSKESCDIILELHEIGLGEVTVTPDVADRLLNTAYANLAKRLEKKRSRKYILHDKEHSSTGGEREAYALMDVSMNGISKNTRSIKWDIELVGLNLIKQIDNESFFVGRKPFHFWFLPVGSIEKDIPLDYSCEITEKDGNLLTIRSTPKHPDKNHYVYFINTIDLTDTVLIKSVVQALPQTSELTQEKYNNTNYNLSNTFGTLKYEQDSASSNYYLAEIQLMETAQIGSESSSYNIFFNTNFYLLKNNSIKISHLQNKKKIKPCTCMLYENKDPKIQGL